MISVTVRLNGILSDFSRLDAREPLVLSLEDGSRVEDLVRALNLPADEVGLAAVNLRVVPLSTELRAGDGVILFPRLPFGG